MNSIGQVAASKLGRQGVIGQPLVVDLDGTLIRSDVLVEMGITCLARQPMIACMLPIWMMKGKAFFKRRICQSVTLDVSTFPYDDAVLTRIRAAKAEGRPVYLASAADGSVVEAIAQHLGVFDGWFASDGKVNLSATAKANRLVEAFGAKGFDYIGNGKADLAVWSKAAVAIAVRAPPNVARHLELLASPVEYLVRRQSNAKAWLLLLRPHQWAKNALVGVPLLTSHQFNLDAIFHVALAFIAFSVCASSAYILNDLVDLQADRAHPTKCKRPIASGDLPIVSSILLAPALLIVAFGTAILVSPAFSFVLATYYLGTTAYSFLLKSKIMLDVVALAGLYTIRVIAGAVAIGVQASEWLLAFSMFIFLSLALIKRHAEMSMRLIACLPDPENRNYKVGDLAVITSLSAASGFSAVIVFALYLSSNTVRELYVRPEVLWLVCPLLIYWISRALILSQRGLMDEDPVIFAMSDKVSLLTGVLIALLGIFAGIVTF